MRARLSLLPLALVVAASAHAGAAPGVACNAIEDAKGDTFAARSQDGAGAYGPQEDGFDIVSADVASDGTTVTGVVRVVKLSRAIASSPQGAAFSTDFLIGDSTDVVSLRALLIAGQPDRFEVSYKAADAVPNSPSTFVGTVTGNVDEAKNEVRIHAPAELLKPHGTIAKGTKLVPAADSATASRGLPAVTTTPGAPMTTRGPFADVALGGKSVTTGAKSCVTVGK